MRRIGARVLALFGYSALACARPASVQQASGAEHAERPDAIGVALGPRPRALVERVRDASLKHTLEACADVPLRPTAFSIGHRGAARVYPEHTRESYEAAARMGAGIIECDVTFTKDRELVCRHSQCDLERTTNILDTALSAKCSVPPPGGASRCCTSDLTLAEFESLCGKLEDGLERDLGESLPPQPRCAKVMSHRESIALIARLGRSFAPELKAAAVTMPFEGTYGRQDFVRAVIADYEAVGIAGDRVFVQTANLTDVDILRAQAPAYAQNAVYLDLGVDEPGGYDRGVAALPSLRSRGVRFVAPPMWALLTLDAGGRIVPSTYAVAAKQSGLELLTFTLERGPSLRSGGGYFYKSVKPAIRDDGDVYLVLDVLARRVGIRGIFSDYPATVTYYANCVGL